MKNFKNCFPMNRAFEWRIASGKMAAKHLHRPTDFGGRSWTVVWTVVWIVSVALSRFLSLYMKLSVHYETSKGCLQRCVINSVPIWGVSGRRPKINSFVTHIGSPTGEFRATAENKLKSHEHKCMEES